MLNRFLGMPENAAEHGFLIDHMLEFCHWFMLILFVGWSAFFLFTIIRFHRSRNPKADYHGVKTHASTHLEFMVVLIEAVLLLGFALPLWARRVNDFPKGDALQIRVIAEQFGWNFHYAGADGVFGKQSVNLINSSNLIGLDHSDPAAKDDIVSRNETHIPFNENVIFMISSKDVIHSFAVQHFRIGQDAIPGTPFPMWFKPIRPGSYEIICAQLCGLGHYNMKATLVVDSKADYDAWLAEMAQLSAAAEPTAAASPTPAVQNVPGTGVQSPSAPVPDQQHPGGQIQPGAASSDTPASGRTTPGPHR